MRTLNKFKLVYPEHISDMENKELAIISVIASWFKNVKKHKPHCLICDKEWRKDPKDLLCFAVIEPLEDNTICCAGICNACDGEDLFPRAIKAMKETLDEFEIVNDQHRTIQ